MWISFSFSLMFFFSFWLTFFIRLCIQNYQDKRYRIFRIGMKFVLDFNNCNSSLFCVFVLFYLFSEIGFYFGRVKKVLDLFRGDKLPVIPLEFYHKFKLLKDIKNIRKEVKIVIVNLSYFVNCNLLWLPLTGFNGWTRVW